MLHIVTEYNAIKTFDSGVLAAITSCALSAALILGDVLRTQKPGGFRNFYHLLVLDAIQLVAGFASFLSCISIPRRPSVVLNTAAVDEQYTVSAFGRYTFAWAGKTLKLARKDTLGLEAIPKLHLRIRSAFLENHIRGLRKEGDHLLQTLLFAHGRTLGFQTFFALGACIIQFAPQLVMFALLRLLEQKTDTSDFTTTAWALVLALGFAILVAAWAEAWTHWIVTTRLGLPLRTQLAAMVFFKAIRRKDVKGATKSEDSSPVTAHGNHGPSPSEESSSKSTQEDLQQSRQGTINLMVSDEVKEIAPSLLIFFQGC